jgi:general stress protein YciG
MGPPDDINQITDLNQMANIAKSTVAKSQVKNTRTSDDVGVELGNAILARYKDFGDDGGYSSSHLNQAAKIAKIYITQGERAGLEAQMKAGVVGEMIDELISDAGLSGIRTIWELDETQGVAEARDGDTNFGSTVTKGSWVVYDGSKAKRFKTRDGAKAYAEKNGGKVASSEFYADNVQKQGVAEAMNEDIERYVEALGRAGYEVNEEKVRLDPKCWKGKKIGSPKTKIKGGVRVNNCVPK